MTVAAKLGRQPWRHSHFARAAPRAREREAEGDSEDMERAEGVGFPFSRARGEVVSAGARRGPHDAQLLPVVGHDKFPAPIS